MAKNIAHMWYMAIGSRAMEHRYEKESAKASSRYSSHAEQHFETDQACGYNTPHKEQSGNAALAARCL
jgi:hypothetical protein